MKKIRAEFALNVTADTGQARSDIERFRELQQRNGMRLPVDVALAQAQADMEAFRARQHANGITIPVNVDKNQLRSASSEVQSFAKKLADIGPGPFGNVFQFTGITALIGELPAATTGIAQFAAALQQLAGAGLAIPGIIGGIAASVGTLVLGLSGIGDAYSAVSKAALSSGQDQASAARNAQSAQNNLRNAVVDETQARRDQARAYRDAKRELEDLNISLRGGQISEQQAVNDALRQRRDLQHDLATGQIKDNIDLQGRLLDIEAADQRVVESHQQNVELQEKVNDANQRGISGSDQVVSANERVTRSQQAVAEAQSAAEQASTKASGAAKAAADAMANISPNARELVNTFVDLKPRIDQALRFPVSDTILAGMSKQIRDLVDADLPVLQKGLGGIAQALNNNFKALGSSLSSTQTQGLLDRILGNTAEAQAKISQFIDPLVQGIGTLTAAGTDALPRIVDDLGHLAERFTNFIEAADKDGRLDKWINDGITGFEKLGSTLGSLATSFTAITHAVGGGDGFLTALANGAQKLSAFLNSVEGQNKLKQWFEEGSREIREHIIPLLEQLPGLFKGLIDTGTQIADAIVPPLKHISEFLGDHPRLIRDVVIAFAAWKGIAGIASLITDLEKINGLLGSGGKGKGGKGGKGILGKLGLITIAGVALDTLISDDGDNPTTPPGATPPPTLGVPSAQIPTGQIPAGQPVPFGTVPVLPPKAVGQVIGGAASGALVAGPQGAAAGAFLAAPGASPSTLPQDQKDLQTLLQFLPQMTDENAKPFADILGVTVDQLRAMPRDELIKRYNAAIASNAPIPPPPPPPPDALAPDFFLGPHAKGGPTPSGRGPGPTGGYLAEVHPDEWILPAHARAAVGDQALWALTKGMRFDKGGPVPLDPNWAAPGDPGYIDPSTVAQSPYYRGGTPGGLIAGHPGAESGWQPGLLQPSGVSPIKAAGGIPFGTAIAGVLPHFDVGGYIDQYGNPITPGSAPGPAPTAPIAPATAPGGITPVVGSFLSGIQGPIGNIGNLIQGLGGSGGQAGGQTAGLTPGLAGLFQAGSDPNKQAAWAQQTGSWLANFAGNFGAQFATTLYTGVLGFFGLDNSILSPSNPWFQAGAKALGIFNNIPGLSGTDTGSTQLGSQTITLGDGSTIQIPTFGTSNGTTGGILNATSRASSFGGASTTYTPEFLQSQGIQPLFSRTTDAKGNLVAQIPPWTQQLAAAFGLSVDSHTDTTLHGGAQGGWAFDFHGKTEDLQRFADFVKTNLAGQTLQEIWQNPQTGQQVGIAGGQVVGPNQYYTGAEGFSMHTDHVHWATDVPPVLVDPKTGQSLLATASTANLPAGGTTASNKQLAQQLFTQYFPASEWAAFDTLEMHEAGYNNTAQNPKSTAFGIGQFLDSTWGPYGAKTSDPATQLRYMFQYIKNRYGTPSNAWAQYYNHPGGEGWYSAGGPTPPGRNTAYPAMLHGDEYVISARGRATVPDSFLHALNSGAVDAGMLPHFAVGGDAALGVPVDPRRPLPRPPDARTIVPPPPPRPPVAAVPGPSEDPNKGIYFPGVPGAAQPLPTQSAPTDQQPFVPQLTPSAPPGDLNHNLPWVNTAIESGAAALGNVASAAIAAGTLGIGALAGGGGGGGGGLGGFGGISVSGLFQQFGKIAKNVANVGSSALVGSVPGSFGDPNLPAGGQTLRPQQKVPVTAPLGPTNVWNITGVDHRNMMDAVNLQQAQNMQAQLATF